MWKQKRICKKNELVRTIYEPKDELQSRLEARRNAQGMWNFEY